MRVGEKLLSTSGVEVDGSFSFMVFDFRVQRVKVCVYMRVDQCRITLHNGLLRMNHLYHNRKHTEHHRSQWQLLDDLHL